VTRVGAFPANASGRSGDHRPLADDPVPCVQLTIGPTAGALAFTKSSLGTDHETAASGARQPPARPAQDACWLGLAPDPASGADCRSPTGAGAAQVRIETPGPEEQGWRDGRRDPLLQLTGAAAS
jgi:hypothetical protein